MKHSKLLLSAAMAAVLAAGHALAAPVDPPKISPGDTMLSVEVTEGTSMAVSVSPDGKTAAIDLQGSIWTVPTAGGKATRITDLFNDARQPVWSPDGKTIVFFAYRDGGYDLWSVNPDGSDQKKLTFGAFDDRDPMWSPDGSKIAFASDRSEPGKGSYNIWTLEVATGKLEQVSFSPFENRLPTWAPDGKSIAYSSARDGFSGIFSVTLGSKDEKELRRSKGAINAASYGPSGQLAYNVLEGMESRLEIDGKVVSGKENVFPFRASWLPGKGGFYYVSDGKIHYRNDVGAKPKIVPFTAGLQVTRPSYEHAKRDFDSTTPRKALGIVRPAISPDGSKFVFIALGDMYVAPIDGSSPPVNLTKDAYLDTDPAWSPDGGKIVYTSDKGGGLPQLWVRDVAAGTDKQLTKMDLQPLEAVWSPDGTKIAYIDVDGMWGVAGVGYVDVATGATKRLTGSLGQPGRPAWSGDSKSIAIQLSLPFSKSFREGTNQIYVIPIDGGAPQWQVPIPNLSIDTRGGGGPAWSPDGLKMAAIYEGLLRVWPVDAKGAPLGPPRSLTRELAHSPSWAGDSKTILYQSNDKLKKVDAETGAITDVPLNLTYTFAKPTGVTVLHVGKLVDSITDKTQTDMDIVIDGNRIADVAPHGSAPYPAGAKVIEAPNLTAIPGLIEFHAHTQKDFGSNVEKAWLAYGITTVRDPGNQPYHGVEDREASESGVRLSPRIYTTGNLMEWQRVYYKMGVAISGPAEMEMELGRAKALKYDMIKSYVRMPDLQQRRLVDFAHNEMGVPVSSHEIYPAAYVGVDSTEHLGATSRRGYSPKQGPLARSYNDVVTLFGQSQRSITPTNFGALIPYLAKHPELKTDPRVDLYPGWAQATVKKESPLAALVGPTVAGNAAGIKAFYQAGAKVVAGTDTPIAINLHAEIASYVDAGLTPFQALQSATKTPAEFLGLDAGVLAKGKLADIVLLDGDPRVDIGNTVRVKTVISNGRVLEEKDLATGK
jgi:Tol biopolymer transport system component